MERLAHRGQGMLRLPACGLRRPSLCEGRGKSRISSLGPHGSLEQDDLDLDCLPFRHTPRATAPPPPHTHIHTKNVAQPTVPPVVRMQPKKPPAHTHLLMRTKPKHLLCPVNLSVMILQSATSPQLQNIWARSSSGICRQAVAGSSRQVGGQSS